jgi:RsiW-degrading membrane proteinase PrsW (M82 family)
MVLAIVVGFLPALTLMVFFYMKDRYEPEPHAHVLATFGFGMVAFVPAAALGSLAAHLVGPVWLALGGLPARLYEAAVCAALPEEGMKWLFAALVVYRWREFDEPLDGIVYCVAIALGLAAVENALYVAHHGVQVGFWRAVFTVPVHALNGALMGYYLGRAKLGGGQWMGIDVTRRERRRRLVASFAVPFFSHTLYDLIVLSIPGRWVYVAAAIISTALWIFVLRHTHAAAADSPFRHGK